MLSILGAVSREDRSRGHRRVRRCRVPARARVLRRSSRWRIRITVQTAATSETSAPIKKRELSPWTKARREAVATKPRSGAGAACTAVATDPLLTACASASACAPSRPPTWPTTELRTSLARMLPNSRDPGRDADLPERRVDPRGHPRARGLDDADGGRGEWRVIIPTPGRRRSALGAGASSGRSAQAVHQQQADAGEHEAGADQPSDRDAGLSLPDSAAAMKMAPLNGNSPRPVPIAEVPSTSGDRGRGR